MADPKLFRLRVQFRKAGRLAMLSHLEVARALERAVRRAHLPYAVSQGFSPHMRIAFGAALPVGVGGSTEFFDLFLTEYVAPDKALVALQAKSAEDMMPLSAKYVDHKAPAASVAFPLSTYEAQLTCEPEEFVVPANVTVVRKKKEKTLQVDEFLVGQPELNGSLIRFTLEAKATGSLRADVFLNACLEATKATGKCAEDTHAYTVTRIAQRTLDGTAL